MRDFWNGKRRYVALLMLIAGAIVGIWVKPVIPVIQLPGEKYPAGTISTPFGPMTNTLMGSIVVWILLLLLMFYVSRRRPKSGDEVPPGGFYNMFEMLYEGLSGFIGNIAGGEYFSLIFKMFMTIFLIVLLSNWTELVPSIDSVGFIEPRYEEVTNELTGEVVDHVPSSLKSYEIYPAFFGGWALNGSCDWVNPITEMETDRADYLAAIEAAEHEALVAEALHNDAEAAFHENYEEAYQAHVDGKEGRESGGCYSGITVTWPEYGEIDSIDVDAHFTVGHVHGEEGHSEDADTEDHSEEDADTEEHGEEVADAEEHAEGDDHEEAHAFHVDVTDPEQRAAWGWVILPYWRAPSTDLNMTLALALIAFVMIQVIGFKALGMGYLTKFFNFGTLFTSPLGGIDVAVGLLELIGDFAKILSFGFRLLGNIFAGSILLFVMSYLFTVIPWPFFLLEFGVGIIQAVVFGLLTAIFMNLATVSHSHDDHAEEH